MASSSDRVGIVTGTGRTFRAVEGRPRENKEPMPPGASSELDHWSETTIPRRIDEIVDTPSQEPLAR